MRLFTWYDVETELKKSRDKWPVSWNRVDVYNDEIIINVNDIADAGKESEKALRDIFEKNYVNDGIVIDFDKSVMEIHYEEGDEDDKTVPVKIPLFKSTSSGSESGVQENLPGSPIVAFHSYKGGVGRTLSLISVAREISEIYGNKKKILVIDADVEAPGLTWMLRKDEENGAVSYLDVLSLMHFYNIDAGLAERIAKLIEKSNLVIETERLEVEQYFLPVYRKKEQVMDIFSSPEKIIASQNNKYIITELISMVGAALKADLILVDLRAGITDFSAPFLFDARVQKYFVSSTSMQSIMGTRQILDAIHEREPGGLQNSKVLLTMIPKEMEEQTLFQIENQLAEPFEKELDSDTEVIRQGYLIRILFDYSLVSLGDFGEICSVLKGKEVTKVLSCFVEGLFEKDTAEEENGLATDEVKRVLAKLNEIATNEITAEGNASSDMLSTSSIREIVRDYQDTVPQIVVLGAKGSGKTYIYKQMVMKKTWGDFIKIVNKNAEPEETETVVVPLISSVNMRNINKLLQECLRYADSARENIGLDIKAVEKNYQKLLSCSENDLRLTEWLEVWRNLVIHTFGERFRDLSEIDEYFHNKNKKVIFLIDGLEDLFMDSQVQRQDGWKYAIRALCQNLLNELRNLQFGNVGIIIFARRDMAEEAIEINFEQFKNQYSRYELKWTPTEALRLALWIAAQASPVFSKDIDILKSSREALEEKLELLWGKKLGRRDSREAISALWIIAALSDFTGQLQARDIVRFLKFATGNLPEGTFTYPDRYIMPSEIRKAIPDCSKDKYKEIQVEMRAIYIILKKFEDIEDGDKRLPLTLDKIPLTGEEIARLESQGYLVTRDKKYYFPEIIRFALGFTYEKGARPRVLSLLAK